MEDSMNRNRMRDPDPEREVSLVAKIRARAALREGETLGGGVGNSRSGWTFAVTGAKPGEKATIKVAKPPGYEITRIDG